jgi:hypothetical protein
MIFLKRPIIFFASLLLVLPVCGRAQYMFNVQPFFSYFSDPGRYELGGSYILPTAQFAGTSRVLGGGNNFLGDSTKQRPLTGQGEGGFIGLSLPFKATGHISCWAAHVELGVNQYTWNDLNQTYSIEGNSYNNVKPALNASTLQVALPVGIEWKVGSDAIESKRLNFASTLGLGVIPNYNMTSLQSVSGASSFSSFGCTPYVKAEGSVFLGILVKVRVMYTIGDVRMLEVNKAIPAGSTDGPFRITSNSDLILSFIIMPFSAGWSETSWWNTHDTYNKHDRLN